jgi:tetrahydromethanopterin S-methyltransferase subunit D
MSGVAGGVGGGAAMYPLYGLGQTSATAPSWQRPMIIFPLGVVAGVGLGWAIWGWFMPRIKKSVRKNIQRGQED